MHTEPRGTVAAPSAHAPAAWTLLIPVGIAQFALHVNAAERFPVESQLRDATEGVKLAAHWAVHVEPRRTVVPASVHAPEEWTLVMPVGLAQLAPHVNSGARFPVELQSRDATDGVKPAAHWAVHAEPRGTVAADPVHGPEVWTLEMPVGLAQFAPQVNGEARFPLESQARDGTEGVKPVAHWAVHAEPLGMVVPSVHTPPFVMPLGAGQPCAATLSHVKFETLSAPEASQAIDATEGEKPAAHRAVHTDPRGMVVPASVHAPEAWTLAMPVGSAQFA